MLLNLTVPALGQKSVVATAPHVAVLRDREGRVLSASVALDPPVSHDPEPISRGPWWGDAPWFEAVQEKNLEEFLSLSGYPQPVRALAAASLSCVFPEEFCRSAPSDPATLALVAPLYERWAPAVLGLLRLGADLAAIPDWQSKVGLLPRLRCPAEFLGACAEVAVWADLVRAGLVVTPDPLGRDERRPEFAVFVDYWRHFVEVKASALSPAERDASRLELALRSLGDVLWSTRGVTVRATPGLEELLRSGHLELRFPELQREFVGALEALSKEPGKSHRTEHFELQSAGPTSEDLSSLSLDLLPTWGHERDAFRLIRMLRESAKQMPAHGTGGVVLDLGGLKNTIVLQEQIGVEYRARPETFKPLSFVIAEIGIHGPQHHHLRRRILLGTFERAGDGDWKIIRALCPA